MGRTFQKVSLVLVCGMEWRKKWSIHSKWDMMKSLTIVTTMETKRDKEQSKERAVVPVSSLFFMSS